MAIFKEEFGIEKHQFASRLRRFADPSHNVEYSAPKPAVDPVDIRNLVFFLAYVEPTPVRGTPEW